ncbi:MAG: threonine--tRNA ligase [Schleiferiaceae bacterium]|tara:strand:- start:20234 stop:22171 length:1938 start_codon:yes stop_codon:yes gene_type:complete
MIDITFPDGSVRNYQKGTSAKNIAESISQGLARNALTAKWNDQTIELNDPINESGKLEFFTWEDSEGKSAFWHSSAHVLAQGIMHFYPDALLTIGPSIENGFYYDVDFGDEDFGEKDFKRLEDKMIEFARQKHKFKMRSVSKKDALSLFKKNPFKTELIKNLEDGSITFCDHSDFTDLCRGGHIPNTGLLKSFKIMSVAGAYWRGDENKPQLSRVYGISFPKHSMLVKHLEMLEEAKKRDHRKLGKELELFTFSQTVGLGLPLWLPKGASLRERLENFLKKVQSKAGYSGVITPHIGNKELYVCSGHYDKYGKDSFQPITTPSDGEEYLLKPMNCPHHCEIYKSSPRSYRDLPIRFAEFGTVYRFEQSGELHGLTRVRGFTQDDAHIFCAPEQLQSEFEKVIDLVLYIFKTLDFKKFNAQISLRDPESPEKYIGSSENWDKAEAAIIDSSNKKGIQTNIEYGEAAFYGPKLDFMVNDALGRSWQLGTIQVDYNLPERFDLTYKGSDNNQHRPVMIHRAPFGSMERFVAVLLEHCAGNFPLWLTPDQVSILPISEKFHHYAEEVASLLEMSDIRALIDDRNEKIGRKIRDSEIKKIPFMIIIGEKEVKEQVLSIRRHGHGDIGTFKIDEFCKLVQEEVENALNAFE